MCDNDLQVASREDVAAAKDALLDRLGMTFAELESEAQRDEFRSERARTAWLMMGEQR